MALKTKLHNTVFWQIGVSLILTQSVWRSQKLVWSCRSSECGCKKLSEATRDLKTVVTGCVFFLVILRCKSVDQWTCMYFYIWFFIQGMDMRFLQTALTMAKTAVYSLHKTSTREVHSVSWSLTPTGIWYRELQIRFQVFQVSGYLPLKLHQCMFCWKLWLLKTVLFSIKRPKPFKPQII